MEARESLASHAGVFRGARISSGEGRNTSAPKNACVGGQGKSKRAEKYGTKKNKERRKGLSRRSLLFFEPYLSARSDFPSPPLSAPGSPGMRKSCKVVAYKRLKTMENH